MAAKKTFYDLHSHILQGMDDGCKHRSDSIAVLDMEFEQGAEGVLSTSHYYPQESIQSFLERREGSWMALREALMEVRPQYVDRIRFGAEVYYSRMLAEDPDLDKLCIGSSRYMLLEMPFKQWSDSTLKGVERMIKVRGIIPVIAHLERFLKLTDKGSIEDLLEMNVIVQMNTENFNGFMSKRKALKMIKNGTVQVLGTDAHNADHRKPTFDAAINALMKAGMEEELDQILAMNAKIYHSAVK